MQIGVPQEQREGETRVAATPDSVKKLKKKGFEVVIAKSAGKKAQYSDEAFEASGAKLGSQEEALAAQIVLKICKPSSDEILKMKKGSLLISLLEPYISDDTQKKLAEMQIDAIALELIPRTSRAQSMDVLSSQAGLAGYRAVIEGASHYGRFFPMMMTSAGSTKACKFAVLGAGVAGLQAIATAKKMGAMVEAYDVRKDAKEQILSLGAKCIELDLGEEGSGSGGYAKELSEEAKKKQMAALTEKLKNFDIIVSTANIPGKKSPTLITEEAIKSMRTGSVVVDMAAANGGNCPLTELGKVVEKFGVKIIGVANFPALVPTDASHFFAQNMVNLVEILYSKEGALNREDDIVAASLVVHKGEICQRR